MNGCEIGRFAARMLAALFLSALATGCVRPIHKDKSSSIAATQPLTAAPATTLPVDALSVPQWNSEVQASVSPPFGWRMSVLPGAFDASHLVWVSPSGRTAYGVIRFSLPLPAPYDPVLWVFLREMRRNEGRAELLSKTWDPERRRLRALIDGGKYTIRTTITLRGLAGWVTYAGTLREHPIEPTELQTAEAARELTKPGPREK
jgi:hypothetical protein